MKKAPHRQTEKNSQNAVFAFFIEILSNSSGLLKRKHGLLIVQ